MKTLPYINLGCGYKYHKDWVNIDLSPDSSYVKSWDLRKGIPFTENTFEVVYHSQLIEHYEKEEARKFIKECYRVLKPGGIIRIVTPDLEDIVRNYLRLLEVNIQHPTEYTTADYEWMLLELYDQAVRNVVGGDMGKYFQQPIIVNEQFVLDRIGFVGKRIRQYYLDTVQHEKDTTIKNEFIKAKSLPKKLFYRRKRIVSFLREKVINLVLTREEKEYLVIGKCRQSGEIHYWLYDRFSLGRLLRESGFRDIKTMNPHLSDIPDWDRYKLDVKNEEVYDPTSLFMEARK
ncbi:MAG: methyltransferase domain-containing protein [Bacteroidota bacterium]